jgi:ribosome-associated toxin RatA of RatAB toxin-antitoxin module
MKRVKKSVLLWYSAQEMYSLVTAIEDYPRFLPWCDSATVLETRPDGVTARLGLHYMGVRHAFTTRNENRADEAVVMKLVDGPFSVLDGTWRFVAIAGAAAACRVEFDLCYAFSRGALEALVSPVFDRIANTFVESFVQRAEGVYGAR